LLNVRKETQMASNQMSNQRRSSGPNQGSSPTRRPSTEYATGFSDEANRDYGSPGDVASQASNYVARSQEELRECIRGREGTALLMAAAAGLGLGLVVGAALGRSHRETLSWRDRVTAEGFGRNFMERIQGMLPEAIAEHFGK
jgi:hypothetical protein